MTFANSVHFESWVKSVVKTQKYHLFPREPNLTTFEIFAKTELEIAEAQFVAFHHASKAFTVNSWCEVEKVAAEASMFLKENFGLYAFGVLLIVAAPAQQAQAATLVSPRNAVEPSDDESQYGRNLRHRQQHWRNHHHDPSGHYDQHHPHGYYDRHYQHDHNNHYHHGR